jgi:hypothetical protein|tara:strand:- start:516 stop:1451 length:936 start_codon:yes stop_codon:yes gene_type:complete
MAFKMKGNPYKMGKMATKSTMKMAKEAMKMKKEAMAKMKKESMAKLKDESAMKLKTSYKMKEAMAKMKDKSAMKAKDDDAVGPKGSATIPSHIREVYPKLTNEAYNKDKSFYDKASRAVIANKQKQSPKKMKKEEAMKMKKEAAMKMKKEAPMKAAKPDFPDIDGDGNTKESMKQAAADKKSMAKMKKKVAQANTAAILATKGTKATKKVAAKAMRKAAVEGAAEGAKMAMSTANAKKGVKAEGSKVAGMKKSALKQDKKKKRKLSVKDKLIAVNNAIATTQGPFGKGPNVFQRYKNVKKRMRSGENVKAR